MYVTRTHRENQIATSNVQYIVKREQVGHIFFKLQKLERRKRN